MDNQTGRANNLRGGKIVCLTGLHKCQDQGIKMQQQKKTIFVCVNIYASRYLWTRAISRQILDCPCWTQ